MKNDILFTLIIVASSVLLINNTKKPKHAINTKKRKREEPIVIKCPGDGNCLFSAIGRATGHSSIKVRKKIVREMHNNRIYYEPFFTPKSKNTKITKDKMDVQDKSYNHYLERMTNQNQWGGQMELVAASKVYKRPVIVYGPTPTEIIETIGSEYFNKEPIKVLYNGNNHYDSIQ